MKQTDAPKKACAGLQEMRHERLHGRYVLKPPPLPQSCRKPADRKRFASAPPRVSQNGRASERIRLPDSVKTGSRLVGAARSHWNVNSKSLLSSILLHLAVLLVLFFLLAPADFGGTGLVNFSLTLTEETQDNAVSVLPATVIRATSSDELDNSISVGLDLLSSNFLGNGLGELGEKSAPGQAGAANGSFFGLEASGHEFVYVLDISGSMSGRRYERAADELIRSVEKLGSHQSFYVLLFNSYTTQMFNTSGTATTPVMATAENKARLANWIRKEKPSGGTDPRHALRIATRMAPSAIFMLSDGQFNGHRDQTEQKLLGGNTDAYSIVAAAAKKTPIHSIAFENRGSRVNMERLAEMTAGQFRFVPPENSVDPAAAVQEAQMALKDKNVPRTLSSLHNAIVNLEGESGGEVKKLKSEIGSMFRELAENGVSKGEIDQTQYALSELVLLDKDATDTGETQQWLAQQLISDVKGSTVLGHPNRTLAMLDDFVQKTPDAFISSKLRVTLAQLRLDRAILFGKKGATSEAIRELDKVLIHYTDTPAFEGCQAEYDRLSRALVEECKDLRRMEGNGAAAMKLAELRSQLSGTILESELVAETEDIATQMLAAARDARLMRNFSQASLIESRIQQALGGDPILQSAKKEMASNERRAQALLQTAMKLERSSLMLASDKYSAVVDTYPDSVAARRAKARLQFFRR
ncbi:MAG: VWA domain-containing protein [Aureliella sp.]